MGATNLAKNGLKLESRLNQQKLSNKISFYYPFIEFIEYIDLLLRIFKKGTDDTSNPLARLFFFVPASE